MDGRDRGAAHLSGMAMRACLIAGSMLLACGAAGAQAAPCLGAKAPRTVSRISLEAAPARSADTLRTVRICLRPAAHVAVGSFHLVVEFDSTLVRAVRFVQGTSGSMVANLTRTGRADIAGADPGGFASPELLALVFAPARTHRFGPAAANSGSMALRLLELNAVSGASLIASAAVDGIGVAHAPAESAAELVAPKSADTPHIDSLVPAQTRAPRTGELVAVTIHGSGFRPEGNAVFFAGTQIAELRSSDGKSLRLLLPAALPSASEVPPRMIGAGRYEIRVRTSAGTSNPMELTLETPQ